LPDLFHLVHFPFSFLSNHTIGVNKTDFTPLDILRYYKLETSKYNSLSEGASQFDKVLLDKQPVT